MTSETIPVASPTHNLTDFQELDQSNHRTAGTRDAGGFVNSAVNSSRADFRFFGKSNMFQIETTSPLTHLSLCHPDIAVISILYSMPISDFSVAISINRFALATIFYPHKPEVAKRIPCAMMAKFGEKLQNLIEACDQRLH